MNGIFNIKNNLCPLCKNTLEYSYVCCPNKAFIPCFECKTCHAYFYTQHDYRLLSNIAKYHKKTLNNDIIFIYNDDPYSKSTNLIKQNNQNKQKKHKNQSKQKPKKNITKAKSMSIASLPYEKYSVVRIVRKNCEFYKNNNCIYLNKECNLNSILCPMNKGNQKVGHDEQNTSQNIICKKSIKQANSTSNYNNMRITVIVINDNRKCIYECHNIQDVIGIVKISTVDGIVDYSLNVAYCKTCNLYIMLKSEFKNLKMQGAILCEIIDYTKKLKTTPSKSISSNESRIHQFGYNVIKDKYTDEQRHAILASIIENTDISKHEIESCIYRPMRQHSTQSSYADAVSCWEKDLEFVRNYQKGDMPEVIIDKIVVGRRVP